MPSSTTLYTSPGNAGNVASKNFTTLYSGSGSINPTQPYGNANVVGLLAASTDGANTIGVISATGNIISDGFFIGDGGLLSNIAGANVSGNVLNAQFVTNPAQANITSVGTLTGLSSTGNITAPYFLGNVVGNITGNIVVGGANTEVLVNNNGNIGPSPGLTFSNASNVLSTSGSVTAMGNIQGNYFLGNGSQLTGLPATYGNANVATFLATFGSNVMSTTGNVTAGYFIGNGSQLTGLPAGYSNADVATFMANFGSNSISTSGNVTTGNITVTTDAVVQGNLTVNGNTTFINSNVVTINDKFINVANNAATAASANGGGLGVGPVGGEYATLEYLSTPNVWATNIGLSVTGNVSAGNISATGNTATGGLLTDNYYYANGTPVSFAGTYSNANVVNLMAAFGSNSISTSGNVSAGNVLIGDLLGAGNVTATGNVTGAFIVGNGSLLSNITGSNVTGTVANATFATSAGSATTAATVTGNAQANITSVGTLTSLSVSGNTTTGNLLTGGIVSATGNVTGNYILGNGSQLTGLPATYGNADVVSLLAAFGANSISTTGNVTAGYVIGNGSLLSNITGANVTGTVANAAFATTAGSATTAATVTGNAQANITSVGTLSSLSVTGTTTSGNILTAGIVSATGNVTGNYFIGNGSQLTGITASPGGSPFQFQYNNSGAFGGVPNTNFYTGNGTIEMALTKFEATGVSGIVTVPGTAGYVSVTGNVIAGNVQTGGVVSATGNITGNYFLGNGSQLTGVAAAASAAQIELGTSNIKFAGSGNAAISYKYYITI